MKTNEIDGPIGARAVGDHRWGRARATVLVAVGTLLTALLVTAPTPAAGRRALGEHHDGRVPGDHRDGVRRPRLDRRRRPPPRRGRGAAAPQPAGLAPPRGPAPRRRRWLRLRPPGRAEARGPRLPDAGLAPRPAAGPVEDPLAAHGEALHAGAAHGEGAAPRRRGQGPHAVLPRREGRLRQRHLLLRAHRGRRHRPVVPGGDRQRGRRPPGGARPPLVEHEHRLGGPAARAPLPGAAPRRSRWTTPSTGRRTATTTGTSRTSTATRSSAPTAS